MSTRVFAIAFLLVWLGILFSALGIVQAKHESRKYFMELQTLDATADELDMEWDRLLIEESTWSNHSQIEQTARHRLQMKLPSPDEVMVIRK